jgi:hypothetical protein
MPFGRNDWKNKLCISKTLNTVLEDILHWCYENRMVLNVSKTKTMCIGSKQKLCTSSDEIFDISINGLQINESQCEKVLGVFVPHSRNSSLDCFLKSYSSRIILAARFCNFSKLSSKYLLQSLQIITKREFCFVMHIFFPT